MNIFVCIKQVPDTETKIVPTEDGLFIETASIKWIVNPYDEFALEEALTLKGNNTNSSVTVVRVGGIKDTEALRTALAMGADNALLVEASDNLDSYMTAKSIKGAIEKTGKSPDIIFTGKQAIDDDCLQVPGLLAQMFDIPSVSVVVGFEQDGDKISLKREIESGVLEVYDVTTPILVACNKGLNTPRYPSLIGIRKAKSKPLTRYSLEEVGVSNEDRRITYSNFQRLPERPPGKKFDATQDEDKETVVKKVASLLKDEAKVI